MTTKGETFIILFKSLKKFSRNSAFTKKENLFFAFLISRSCRFTMSCPKYLNFNFFISGIAMFAYSSFLNIQKAKTKMGKLLSIDSPIAWSPLSSTYTMY